MILKKKSHTKLKKTILIIGSTGFIGLKLKKKLSKNYKLININKSIGLDITQNEIFNKFSNQKIDFILNLSGQNNLDYRIMKKTIINGNQNIINFCKNKKTLVYYFSTSLVYGYSTIKKKENMKLKPLCKYSKLKLNAEKLYQKSKINYKILRVCNLYDNKKDGVIKNIINAKIKKKIFYTPNINTYRNYLFVDDFVNLICKTFKTRLKHNIYNVGFENISLITIIKSIEKKFKFKINYENKNEKLKKIPSQKINCEKILKEINFLPKVKIIKYINNKLSA